MTVNLEYTEYDIQVLNEERDRRNRPGQYILIAGPAVLLGLSILFGARDWAVIIRGEILTLRPLTTLGIWALTIFFSYEALTAFLVNRPGARRIRLSTQWIEAMYADGHVERFGWKDPRSKVRIYDWPLDPVTGKAIIFHRVGSLLTPEAFSGIMAAARARGSPIQHDVHWMFPPSLKSRVYTIHGSGPNTG